MKQHTILSVLLWLFIISLSAQSPGNVGIGTQTPTETLEVEGIVYTNQGGIKFPDETVQTTAAYNADPEDAAMPRGIGLIKFLGIPAPFLDTLGISEASVIFDMQLNMTRVVVSGGGGGSSLMIDQIMVLKDIDEASIGLANAIMDNLQIPEAMLYLIREDSNGNGEIYRQIELTGVSLVQVNNSLVHLGELQFAHVEKLGIIFEEICIEDLVNPALACFNIVTQSAN